ncbi:MAG: hypothetical protein O7C56_05655, partial [Rickettsia endosymbiont of Ixodes persulcatus]|nr:hypothetical protein [Rickettsia endosymbiont of Ixodes persulcatus]
MNIEVLHLTKTFGSYEAVSNVSFSINRGKLIALLGPSGGSLICFGRTDALSDKCAVTTPAIFPSPLYCRNVAVAPPLQVVDQQQQQERGDEHHQCNCGCSCIIMLLQLRHDQKRRDFGLERHIAGDEYDRPIFPDASCKSQRKARQHRRHQFGFTILYLSIIVLIPLVSIFIKTSGLSLGEFWQTVTNPRVVASYKISFFTAFFAALINLVFGLLVAWVLVRYRFPGKKLIDSLLDLPFALPTAVAGIALTTIYAPNGWIGSLLGPLGIKVAYTPIGITIALIFIGLPFVVRTVQP